MHEQQISKKSLLESGENKVHVIRSSYTRTSIEVEAETIRLYAIHSKVLFVLIFSVNLHPYIILFARLCVYILPPSLCISPYILAYISRFCIMKANWKCSPPHAVDESQLLCTSSGGQAEHQSENFFFSQKLHHEKYPNENGSVQLRGMVNNKQQRKWIHKDVVHHRKGSKSSPSILCSIQVANLEFFESIPSYMYTSFSQYLEGKLRCKSMPGFLKPLIFNVRII